MFRPDYVLVRHLAETSGVHMAQTWQALPYILLPGEGFAAYALDRLSRARVSPPDTLPWEDAVYDFPEGTATLMRRLFTHALGDHPETVPEVPDRGRCWMRVRTVTQPGRGYVVECWEEHTTTGGLPAGPDLTFLPWSYETAHRGRALHLFPNPRCPRGRYDDQYGWCNLDLCNFPHDPARQQPCYGSTMVMSAGAALLQATLTYLLGMDEYLVQVEPVLSPRQAKQRAKHQARGDGKPWTREDLPYYILIDPQRAAEYGRVEESGGEGHHASPRPHQRRGHWRELRAERFEREVDGSPRRTWIKPMWVGESEWTSEGRRYRVIPPRF